MTAWQHMRRSKTAAAVAEALEHQGEYKAAQQHWQRASDHAYAASGAYYRYAGDLAMLLSVLTVVLATAFLVWRTIA